MGFDTDTDIYFWRETSDPQCLESRFDVIDVQSGGNTQLDFELTDQSAQRMRVSLPDGLRLASLCVLTETTSA